LQKEETHTLLQLLYLLNKNNLSIPIQFIIFYYQHLEIIQKINVEDDFVYLSKNEIILYKKEDSFKIINYIIDNFLIEKDLLFEYLNESDKFTTKKSVFVFDKLKKKYPNYKFKLFKKKIFFDFNFHGDEIFFQNLFNNLENEKKNPKTEMEKKKIINYENYEITKIFFNCLDYGLEKEKFKYNFIFDFLNNYVMEKKNKPRRKRYKESNKLFADTLRYNTGNRVYDKLLHGNVPCLPSSNILNDKIEKNNKSGIQKNLLKNFIEKIKSIDEEPKIFFLNLKMTK
jgi:hypothetical protein